MEPCWDKKNSANEIVLWTLKIRRSIIFATLRKLRNVKKFKSAILKRPPFYVKTAILLQDWHFVLSPQLSFKVRHYVRH